MSCDVQVSKQVMRFQGKKENMSIPQDLINLSVGRKPSGDKSVKKMSEISTKNKSFIISANHKKNYIIM